MLAEKDDRVKEEKVERRIKRMKKEEIKVQIKKEEGSSNRGIKTQRMKMEERSMSWESSKGSPGAKSELGHSWEDDSDAATELGTGVGESERSEKEEEEEEGELEEDVFSSRVGEWMSTSMEEPGFRHKRGGGEILEGHIP